MNKRDIIGKTYETDGGVRFKVINTESYPASKVTYKKILDFKEERLVAVNYRGTLIPNITFEDGVSRLTKVEVGGKTLSSPKAISEAIGVKKAMEPYGIKEIV